MMKTKGVLALCLVLALIISLVSGVVLWLCPGGMVLGVARWIVTGVHNWSSVAFGALCIVHLLLNLKLLRAELSAFRKKKKAPRG